MQNKAEYLERYERHTRGYEKMQKQYETIEAEQEEMPIEFNDDLWLAAVDHATVNADEMVTFTFKSGIEIMEQM